MHVGYSAFIQNLSGEHTDAEVYRHELALADLAEPLGFNSVWAPEHHFTNYIMMPDTNQFLTWIAARTERVQLGSMINVLPLSARRRSSRASNGRGRHVVRHHRLVVTVSW